MGDYILFSPDLNSLPVSICKQPTKDLDLFVRKDPSVLTKEEIRTRATLTDN